MQTIKPALPALLFIAVIILIFTSCNQQVKTPEKPAAETDKHLVEDYGFIITGVTGKEVMLDVTWYRDCMPDGFGGMLKSIRTMSGKELATTQFTYRNDDATPNCNDGLAMVMQLVTNLTYKERVPITWIDAEGNPSNAPKGLEHVQEGNGAEAVATYASCTPLIQAQVDALNATAFGGISDWEVGVTRDVLPYFKAAGKMKGTVVVDDRTSTGYVYDGIATDPTKYPTNMPNYAPHSGNLNGLRF